MKYRVLARLVEAHELDPTTFRHVYEAPQIARECAPGQFLHIRVSPQTAPLLRRPISILWSDGHTHVEVMFKVVRAGTALLASRRIGDEVDLVGPLGNPFPYDFTRDAVMVAGGYGIAPLAFLARWNVSNHNRRTLIYGARSADALYLLPEWKAAFDRVIVTTEDGSLGRRGLATDPLRDLLVAESHLAVYACGPTPMLAAVARTVAEVAEPGTPCYVSLENRMGCGVGACLGCVVPTKQGFKTTCREGPVFSANEICFEELLEKLARY
jgi:dihydroorotate dehydrogenase electron transfer subunit